MAGFNETNTLGEDEARVGLLTQEDALTLNMTDQDVGRLIKGRITNSGKFWDKELNLTNVRDSNEKYYLNKALDEAALYEYQVPYKDNRIFLSVETMVPMVNARMAMPIVTEAQDTEASRELATDLGYSLMGLYDDLSLKPKFSMVTRHLVMGFRLACLKYSWDAGGGFFDEEGEPMGEIAVNWVRPQRLIIDEGADDISDVPLIAEVITNTAEEIILKYPEKTQEIYREFGFVKGTRSQLGSKRNYHEAWFSYYDKKGIKQEAVAWLVGNTLLGKMKNPHWNYDEWETDSNGDKHRLNFFKRPQKPYVLFNYINTGKYILDDTSLTEQASNQQDILNKRGRQIVENADSANSGTVYNSEMISADDVSKITGDPSERVVVKGPVGNAAMRLPTNLLPEYVLQDKYDARNEIDNIFGTHAPIRGEKSKTNTLGQEVMSQRSDLGRTQTLADAMEGGGTRLYQGLVQMMKVFWDTPQKVQYTGADGKTMFLEFSRNMIQDGVKVRVKAGSVLPDDKFTKREETLKALALLDPLSIAEGLSKPNPKEFAKRMVLFKAFLPRYMTEVLQDAGEGQVDADALDHIKKLNYGELVQPGKEVKKEHLATHEVFIKSDEFKELTPEVRQLHFAHVRMELTVAKEALGMDGGTEAPPGGPLGEATPGGEGTGLPGQAPPGGEGEPAAPALPMGGQGNFVQALMARLKGGGQQ